MRNCNNFLVFLNPIIGKLDNDIHRYVVSIMARLYDVGRCCVILRGRRTGKKAVVVDIIDQNFVLITGPPEITGVKRRRMNIDHLLPLNIKLNISKGASDEDVAKVIREQKLEDFFKEQVRIPREYL